MGVRGLTTFVQEDGTLSEKYYLHDCKLVIDGHSLMFWLTAFSVNPSSKVEQEYSTYGDAVRHFFNGLQQCGVEPFVVFDGPATEEKYDKVLRTLEGNVAAIEGMFHTDDEEMNAKRLLPPFSLDAIMQVMVDLKVPFASSLADADSELVALANFLGCPLLAEDSDYCIFNVEHGYISLRSMPGGAEEGETKLCCKRFLSQNFCQKWSVTATKLPFLSIILGNDWVLTDVFTEKIYNISKYFKVDRRDYTWRVKAALLWLSQREAKSDEVILEELHQSLPSTPERAEIITRIKYSISVYRELPDISKLIEILCPELTLEEPSQCKAEKPVSVEDAVRWCYVHFSAYHLTQLNFVGLPSAIVCDTHKHSLHLCSVEIRNFVYRCLLRRFCLAKEGPKVVLIEEYDFDDGASYGKARGVNIYTSICPFCEHKHGFDDQCDQCRNTTGKTCEFNIGSVLSRILSVKFEHSFKEFCKKQGLPLCADLRPDLHERLDVVMLATLYWLKETSPGHRSVASLLLTLALIPSISFKFRKVLPSSFLPEGKLSDKSNKKGSEELPKNEESLASNESPKKNQEFNISLRPTWYRKKIAEQKMKEVEDAFEKDRLKPPPEVSELKMSSPTKNLIQYVNLFRPLAPVKSKSGRIYWWTLQDDFETDMELLHSIAEWQGCLWAVLLLHQAVEYNGLHLGLHDIFGSNLTLHEIHARLSRSETGREGADEDLNSYLDRTAQLLNASPSTKNNYIAMVKFLLQTCTD